MSRNECRSLELEDVGYVGESWDVETVSDFCLLMNFYSQRRFLHQSTAAFAHLGVNDISAIHILHCLAPI